MCNACGFFCCACDAFEGCGCDCTESEACWTDDDAEDDWDGFGHEESEEAEPDYLDEDMSVKTEVAYCDCTGTPHHGQLHLVHIFTPPRP